MRPRSDVASQFIRFALVGAAGFVVDVSVLYVATKLLGTGPYLGRGISYVAAASFTWYLNRRVTFADRRGAAAGREWGRFVTLNAAGGLLNYAAYALWLRHAGAAGASPAIGVALGSLAGLIVNFTLSRQVVFRASRAMQPDGTQRADGARGAPDRGTRPRRVLALTISGALLTVGLIWPALYNGQPIFFGDTSAYIRGADAGVQAAFHRRSAWSLAGADSLMAASPSAPRPAAASVPSFAPDQHGSSIRNKSVLYGRSPYYGALLYLGDLVGGMWLTVVIQAGAVLLALALVVRAAGMPLWPTWVAAGACLILVTSAPFFASFLMPDVFAGVAILAAAALLAAGTRLARIETIAAFALLAASITFHESHLLIVGVVLAIALVRAVIRRSWTSWRGMTAVAAALGAAVSAQLAFGAAVKHVIGAAPLRPPFLTGRVIEDGPGYRYLRETCPENGFEVCAFLDRLPMPANLFVWDTGPRGVFGAAAPAVRRRLADEQLRFVLAVVAHHPLQELRASLAHAGSLLTMAGLDEFEYGPGEKDDFASKVPRVYLGKLVRTPAYRDALPTTVAAALSTAGYAIGAAVLLVVLAWRPFRSRIAPPLAGVCAWILMGVLVNAIVCGVLSGPHNRYEARVAWTLPLAAVLLALPGTLLAWHRFRAAQQMLKKIVADDGTQRIGAGGE